MVVPDEDMTYLNQPAVAELQSSIERYCDELLKEASRLEATAKTTQGDPEITSSMIRDATLLLRRGYRRPKKKLWLIIAQVVAPVTGVVAGLLADMELLKEPLLLVAFVVFLSIASTSTVLVVVKE